MATTIHHPLHDTLEYAIYTLERIVTSGNYTITRFREESERIVANMGELWWDSDALSHDAYHSQRQATWRSVESLEGLQHAEKLKNLVLNRCDITDLEPIRDLKITTLYLEHNTNLEQIDAIASLSSLERLRLDHTAIQSLRPLTDLKRLRELNLRGVTLDDDAIEVLADLRERDVKITIDPEARERLQAVIDARLASAPKPEDPVAKALVEKGLGEIAALWSQGVHATDIDGKTSLHMLLELPEDRMLPRELAQLANLMCQQGARTHALCYPMYGSAQTPLTLAIGRRPLNTYLLATLVEHTTRWDIPLIETPAALAIGQGSSGSDAKAVQNIILAFDYSMLPTASLVAACREGRLDLVKQAIESGASPDPDYFAHTPLYAAVDRDHIEIARYLLEAGADPNRRSTKTYLSPPLHACRSIAMLELLMEHGADPTQCDQYGHTAITRIVSGHAKIPPTIELITQLFDRGCPKRDVDGALLKWTDHADEETSTARLELLESHGIELDPNHMVFYRFETKPSSYSIMKKHKDRFGLKGAKAPTHIKQLVKLYENKKKSGELTPGTLKWRIAIKLLRHMHRHIKGVDSLSRVKKEADRAIRAYMSDEDEILEEIVSLQASVPRTIAAMLWLEGPQFRDDAGRSCLDYVVGLQERYGDKLSAKNAEALVQVALMLIEAGATPGFDHAGLHTLSHALNSEGVFSFESHTPLFDELFEPAAAPQALQELLRTLNFGQKGDESHRAWLCEQAMGLALDNQIAEYFFGTMTQYISTAQLEQLLEETSAHPDGLRMEHRNLCPLGAAAKAGRGDVIKLLLDAGAEVDGVQDSRGSELSWPLGHASTAEVVRLLCKAGADPNARRRHLDGAIPAANAAVLNLKNNTDRYANYIGALEALRDLGASFEMPSARKPNARQMLESLLDEQGDYYKERNKAIKAFLKTLVPG